MGGSLSLRRAWGDPSEAACCAWDGAQEQISNINSVSWLAMEGNENEENEERRLPRNFPDLSQLPPELALTVLSNLNATDLCLAACVWQQLASDEILWQGLCREQWPEANIICPVEPNANEDLKNTSGDVRVEQGQEELSSHHHTSYKKVYLMLDEGTLTFNSDAHKGMDYFFKHGLLVDRPEDIAKFFHHTSAPLSKSQMRYYLQDRQDIVECMMTLQNYRNQFLPNALRKCFSKLEAPNDRGPYLQELLDSFSRRFCQCNPELGYTADSVYVMCFSLILLSVDLTSPHVKNKMSKREFIRNTRNAIQLSNDELFGEMYDNVFLRGHVSGEGNEVMKTQHQFVPGYLAMFL